MSVLVSWETVTAVIGCVALVLEWFRARGVDQTVDARIDDHEQRLRSLELGKRGGS
jgi:hypothetical protein